MRALMLSMADVPSGASANDGAGGGANGGDAPPPSAEAAPAVAAVPEPVPALPPVPASVVSTASASAASPAPDAGDSAGAPDAPSAASDAERVREFAEQHVLEWSPDMDVALTQWLHTLHSNRLFTVSLDAVTATHLLSSENPSSFSPGAARFLTQFPALASVTPAQCLQRVIVLQAFNKAVARVLPLVDLRAFFEAALLRSEVDTAAEAAEVCVTLGELQPPGVADGDDAQLPATVPTWTCLGARLAAVRTLVFTDTKLAFWQRLMSVTASAAPSDRLAITVDRLGAAETRDAAAAASAGAAGAAAPAPSGAGGSSAHKHVASILEQAHAQMFSAAPYKLRQPPAQPHLAFEVAFARENVIGEGGPYRAFFSDVVFELTHRADARAPLPASAALPLLTPVPNSLMGHGDQQDAYLLRAGSLSGKQLELLELVGRFMGSAMRTRSLMPLQLPSLFWKPVVAQALALSDLDAVAQSVVRGVIQPLRKCATRDEFDELFKRQLKWRFKVADGTVVDLRAVAMSLAPATDDDTNGMAATAVGALAGGAAADYSSASAQWQELGDGDGDGDGDDDDYPASSAAASSFRVPSFAASGGLVGSSASGGAGAGAGAGAGFGNVTVYSADDEASGGGNGGDGGDGGGDADADDDVVEFEDRLTYAAALEHTCLHQQHVQLAAVLRGLSQVVPMHAAALLTDKEMEAMVCGSPTIDVELLKRHTEYSGLSAQDDVVQWFWRVLKDEFVEEDRRRFIKFAWGQERLPNTDEGFSAFPRTRMLLKAKPPPSDAKKKLSGDALKKLQDNTFITADTCFFNVSLPAYSSFEALKTKMLAIVSTSSWGMDGDANLTFDERGVAHVRQDDDGPRRRWR